METFDLFLIPTINQYEKYTKIINSLSKRYSTPSFPHITLFEKIEANEKDLITQVNTITKDFNKIEVEVLGMNFANTIHQCVFAQIKMSSELLTLYNELEKTLHYSNQSIFFPHMSMVYGNLQPEEKQNIAANIELDSKLLLDTLLIYRDGSLASDWEQVAEFKFR
jgi:2'-5' RNA ligase